MASLNTLNFFLLGSSNGAHSLLFYIIVYPDFYKVLLIDVYRGLGLGLFEGEWEIVLKFDPLN